MAIEIIGGGVSEHADLTDLDADDHAQYVYITRDGSGRIVYYYGLTVPDTPASGSLWLEATAG